MIIDSGDRKLFPSGAVRDINTDKGKCDLVPLDIMCELVDSYEIACIETFRRNANVAALYNALDHFAKEAFDTPENMILEVSKHFAEGAAKYDIDNWKKGIPIRSYIDSGIRHYLKYRMGIEDERHDRAFVWNLLCCAWTFKNKPELDDFTEKKCELSNV